MSHIRQVIKSEYKFTILYKNNPNLISQKKREMLLDAVNESLRYGDTIQIKEEETDNKYNIRIYVY